MYRVRFSAPSTLQVRPRLHERGRCVPCDRLAAAGPGRSRPRGRGDNAPACARRARRPATPRGDRWLRMRIASTWVGNGTSDRSAARSTAGRSESMPSVAFSRVLSRSFQRSCDCHVQSAPYLLKARVHDAWSSHHQHVEAVVWRQFAHQYAQPATDAIADDRPTHAAADREPIANPAQPVAP